MGFNSGLKGLKSAKWVSHDGDKWRILFSKIWRRGVAWYLATFRENIVGLSWGINIEAACYFEATWHLTSEESKYSYPSQYDVILSNGMYNVEAETSQSVEWHATGRRSGIRTLAGAIYLLFSLLVQTRPGTHTVSFLAVKRWPLFSAYAKRQSCLSSSPLWLQWHITRRHLPVPLHTRKRSADS
jgi:hypothetical protein